MVVESSLAETLLMRAYERFTEGREATILEIVLGPDDGDVSDKFGPYLVCVVDGEDAVVQTLQDGRYAFTLIDYTEPYVYLPTG
jgi:hypothetical protein